MSFSNKVVLVTGGSSGIGAATAVIFAREGAHVAIVGRNETKLNKVAADITKVGNTPLIIKADVSKHEELKTIVKKTFDKFGRLDVLVNNAGILKLCNILDDDLLEAYDEVMNTNIRSAVLLTHLAAPLLIKTKGNIVNVSSVAANSTLSSFESGYASYCASKAAMDQFSRVAALELAEHGVRVNTVNPGPVKTHIFDDSGCGLKWDVIAETTAMKILSKPEDVGNLILYLASDKAYTITGSHFKIDSGMTLKF